ncbi:ABC transporter substrate-binding protein [Flammeovirga sp. EKP202]|uniref:ABC transporter substrate-binding protein n=1 Tax=Flammeovirga sp. EKP202 TaxID=2770592 RepID=UPI001660004A|nr:ABC transporter substrate-binding protein [Flammeovirga sp. EKP202]MBD0401428.1 ABC transporter substrate-binding protein [Flammeovirga sp. EKP202]
MDHQYPQRIVCLTDEVTEWLYLLGEQDRIVGISAFADRPEEAKKEKPMVCGFTGANFKKIMATQPDLVIGFSDLQADIASRLIKKGIPTLITNQRSISEIMNTLMMIARIVGADAKAKTLMDKMYATIEEAKQFSQSLKENPKIYFEEWDDPIITGIQWVSEIITLCGGVDIFIEHADKQNAQGRVLANFEPVVERNPDIGLFCWCGKKMDREAVLNRPNIQSLSFYKNNEIHEVDPIFMLQPGPATIMEGIPYIMNIIKNWSQRK